MKIIAVDIDGTLAEEEEGWKHYHRAIPRSKIIAKINRLYDEGHTIVIHTSRWEEDKRTTEQWLKEHGIKYHYLVMDKFRADVYIDSQALRPEEL